MKARLQNHWENVGEVGASLILQDRFVAIVPESTAGSRFMDLGVVCDDEKRLDR